MQSTIQCRQDAGVFHPAIDRNRCEGKGDCVPACPFSVFEVATLPRVDRAGLSPKGLLKGFVHRWQQAFVVKPNVCEACGLCVQACPENAITLARV